MTFIRKIINSIKALPLKYNFRMRTKLIIILVLTTTVPLIIITIIAVMQSRQLTKELYLRADGLKTDAFNALSTMGQIAASNSEDALNSRAVIQLERISTDIAKQIAAFLYDRDKDILSASMIEPDETAYRNFLRYKTRSLIKQQEWLLAEDKKSWVPQKPLEKSPYSNSSNADNNIFYQNRPAELWETEERPLYPEMTYIDLNGVELIKITSSPQMDAGKKDVSNRRNTYIRSETYFQELKKLKAGEIYVSDVIGAYVRSHLIGMYTPENAASRGLEFTPELEAFAGRENPQGRRFKGIIRWAVPVVRNGSISGYVTLALDHDHIMEFVDHITPMDERYVEMPSASDGNYAFIWDYKCRCIAHPRHHSIVGYNPLTGEAEIPWLEDSIYNEWQASGLPYTEFIKNVPVFHEQSRSKKPAAELTAQGLVGLDGRYLNNAPQCTGWFDLTREGGSGSFLIFWSGIWKPNTAAAIPYYTGNYGRTKRGFGFVAIGAGFEDFQRPAHETEIALSDIITEADNTLNAVTMETDKLILSSLYNTTVKIGIVFIVIIIIVILIAILMASVMTSSITNLVNGITRFRYGERHFRFNSAVKDEIGTLADSFDEMAESLNKSDRGPIIIISNDLNVIYINELGLVALGKKLEEVLGRPYSEISIYPNNSAFDPIAALHEGRETEVMYTPELGCYFKGEASYMLDSNGKIIGHIITSVDVTDIMEQQQRLEQAVEEAKLANEHKSNFLARMSHEIRTPMNAIIGMTDIVNKQLSSGNYNLDAVKTNIGYIETSSHHLLGLLNDILDFSKIEAGKIELNMEDVDILKLANTVVTIIQPRCTEKNITFKTHFDLPANKSFLSDALRLRQVLINLLGNAVKFTPENGEIAFSIVQNGTEGAKSRVDFCIRDTGIGIDKDVIKNLFTPFQQANSQIAQKYGGTGLGLGISKNIVQMLGGDISVKSELGKGSEFSFSLLLNEHDAIETEEIQMENISGRLIGKRALLVDDVAINRIIVINMLETTGIEVDEAGDGTEAVSIFSNSPIDTYNIIYMDVQMPEMNGYDAAKAIRVLERSDAKTVPIIAFTANAFREDIDKALACGMNAHLAKPIEAEKLMSVTLKYVT